MKRESGEGIVDDEASEEDFVDRKSHLYAPLALSEDARAFANTGPHLRETIFIVYIKAKMGKE